MNDYEVVIGLEVHAELATKTKIFCSCKTNFGGETNTQCCEVCTGQPGSMPVMNEKVVEYGAKAGLATNCRISKYSKMDRKNYFYPDLPKAYQISQFDLPLCQNGHIMLKSGKKIGITRIHMEEDAGKLLHDEYTASSLIDMNRCSVPLIEIVSEPDIRTKEEAIEYMQNLKSILEYIEVCDCKMQEGSLRCDVNLSVRKKGETKFGTRTETKNLNSFKSIERSIDFEINRQITELENGGTIYQETRRFDDDKGIGYAMRTKEDAHDYRYFADPDLTSIELTDEYIQNLKNNLPELPQDRKNRYINEYNLSEYDARLITDSKMMADYFDSCMKKCNEPKTIANWMLSDLSRLMNDNNVTIDKCKVTPENLAELIELINKGTISSTIAKKVLNKIFETGKKASDIVKEDGLVQITDDNAIIEIIERVLDNNQKSLDDYFAGKNQALGYLVGQTMKESKGKANPALVNKLLSEAVEKRRNV